MEKRGYGAGICTDRCRRQLIQLELIWRQLIQLEFIRLRVEKNWYEQFFQIKFVRQQKHKRFVWK